MEVLVPFALIAGLIFILVQHNKSEKAKREIICPNPNCGYRGQGNVSGSKSGCLLIILLCLGVLPGILYLLFAGRSGSMICPKCGMRVR